MLGLLVVSVGSGLLFWGVAFSFSGYASLGRSAERGLLAQVSGRDGGRVEPRAGAHNRAVEDLRGTGASLTMTSRITWTEHPAISYPRARLPTGPHIVGP